MLSIKNLVKIYKPKKADPVLALDHVSIDFPETGLVFLLGKSGSGKSTLLNSIGGLDKFDEGEIIIKGKSSNDFSTTDFDSYRNTFIGFIFQEYNVLEEFTVAKNLALAVELQGKKAEKAQVDALLEQVDMLPYAKRKPNQLSGGQKQRIAIARALIKNPEIIMADEPTGALDSNTGKQVMETLKKLSQTKLVIIVSHDREFAEAYGDRIIELKDGKIIRDVTKKEVPSTVSQGIKIIDNDLIVISKGQKLTNESFKKINEAIQKKIAQEDVIISLEQTANNKMKTAASINDNGNKESFLKTEPEDVKLKQYNKKDLHLIKSRLKTGDAFKMGASGLKYKKGKLFFTILLSVIAFVMFGIVDTFSCFNKEQSVCDTLAMVHPEVVSVAAADYGKYELRLNADDLKSLETKSNQKFYPVKGWGNNSCYVADDFNNKNSVSSYSSTNQMFRMRPSGYMVLDENIARELGVALVAGSYPKLTVSEDSSEEDSDADEATKLTNRINNLQQIVITKHLADCYFMGRKTASGEQENNNNANTPNDYQSIIGKVFDSNNGNNRYYKIVGVLDDKVDFSAYIQENEENALNNMMAYEGSSVMENYGFSNLLFVCSDVFAKINTNINSNSQKSYYLSGEQVSNKSNIWATFSDTFNLQTYYKAGVDKTAPLTDNQVKISASVLTELGYTGTPEEFLAGDAKITLGKNTQDLQAYEVVAVTSYQKSSYYPEIYFAGEENAYSPSSTGYYADLGDKTASENLPHRYFYQATITAIENMLGITAKDGFNGTLTGKQIAISEYTLKNYLGYTKKPSEFLKGDTKITLYYNYDRTDVFREDLEIVAIIDNSESYVYVDKDLIKSGEYSFAVTKGGNEQAIRNLNKAFKDLKVMNTSYKFEDKTTVPIDTFGETIEMLTQPLLWVSLGLALFSALFLSNFISTSISYKKREIGILRAIGARSWDVFKIFFYESFIIGGITYLISVIGTGVSCFFINKGVVGALGIALLSFGIRQLILMLGITLLIAAVATFLPVRRIARKKPIDAINNR